MIKQEVHWKRIGKKAGRQQRKWIRQYIKGKKWVKRRNMMIRAAAGIFFLGWIGLWLYESANKKVTTTETYLLPKEQEENFYSGKSIEIFGIQIRIHEGNLTFFREKREAQIEESLIP